MKVIYKEPIPTQACKCCRSIVAIRYKDLLRNGWALNNSNWKCPLCKTEQMVEFNK